jgi:hypothetical protein
VCRSCERVASGPRPPLRCSNNIHSLITPIFFTFCLRAGISVTTTASLSFSMFVGLYLTWIQGIHRMLL